MEKKRCRKCQSERIVKAGFKKLANGKVQRFKCQACGYYFTSVERYHYLPPEKVELIHRMYEEKGEMRKIARALGITLKAVQYHLKKKDEDDT